MLQIMFVSLKPIFHVKLKPRIHLERPEQLITIALESFFFKEFFESSFYWSFHGNIEYFKEQ